MLEELATRHREASLLVVCMVLLIAAGLTTPWLGLGVIMLMLAEWSRYRHSNPSFDFASYTLSPKEQVMLDDAAAAYVDARRALNRVESRIRESGFSIDDAGRLNPEDHVGHLQRELNVARQNLDPEPVLQLARLPLARADAALRHYSCQQGAKWGIVAFPAGMVMGLPVGPAYTPIAGGIASVLAFMVASHLSSRAVIHFLMSLPQAMPQFDRDQVRREQVRAAARSLASKAEEKGSV
ncbi:MAG: hypothetical protein R3200_02315 [Xanthomonadales bacterium]|nr:hypothetical protein [Xanthomonadales bacterium]